MKALIAVLSLGFSALAIAQEAIPSGTYQVIRITCNGQPANTATRSAYISPNSLQIIFGEQTGAFVDVVNEGSCLKNIPLRFETQSTSVTAYFNGPISCTPETCDPACGLDLPLSVNYEYHFLSNRILILTSDVYTADTACTAGGQENPIEYTLRLL
jgi:hypothetical protein